MKEKFLRYIFHVAFRMEDSNNFEIKEILNYASCGQLFEGGGFQRCSEVFCHAGRWKVAREPDSKMQSSN